MLPDFYTCNIAVIGLGYVGLPLCIQFKKIKKCLLTGKDFKRKIIGFDINTKRIEQLKNQIDLTNEVSGEDLNLIKDIYLTSNPDLLAEVDIFIVTVPTPVDKAKSPDLEPLKKASKTIGLALSKRYKKDRKSIPFIIYESTVYPGATEEICVPILEKISGFSLNNQNTENSFLCGYSPERINPGDKTHNLDKIVKVTSGSSPEASEFIDKLYKTIISAGTFKAASIKVAETAKIIENTQRDINIALMNEVAMINKKLGIDTLDVLEAAETKWNFLKFKPGLVGGHCIGVDPYYLTYKASMLGYTPEMVLSGRRINDSMHNWIVEQFILEISKNKISLKNSTTLILGLTFKENCPDLRNTKSIEIINQLRKYFNNIDLVDPIANQEEARELFGIQIHKEIPFNKKYSAILVLVGHNYFKQISIEQWQELLNPDSIIFDIKGIVNKDLSPIRI